MSSSQTATSSPAPAGTGSSSTVLTTSTDAVGATSTTTDPAGDAAITSGPAAGAQATSTQTADSTASSDPTSTAPTTEGSTTVSGPTMAVRVFLGTGGQDCAQVKSYERQAPRSNALIKAALNQLLQGPTAAERADGATASFSSATADDLIGVNLVDGTAYVNFRDFSNAIPNASTSCGSIALLNQLSTTVKSAGEVSRVVYAFSGDPRPFYEWLQMACDSSNDNCSTAHFLSR